MCNLVFNCYSDCNVKGDILKQIYVLSIDGCNGRQGNKKVFIEYMEIATECKQQ